MLKSPTARRQIGLVFILIVLLYLVLAFAFYAGIASKVLGANDYFSRWMGARLFFQQGLDPYSEQVTQQIQLGMFGQLVPPNQDQVAFAYPFYAVFFTYPLLNLPFALASSFWIALLFMLIGAAAIVLALHFDWQPSVWWFPALLAFALIPYPSMRGFFLGQYALLVTACLAFALLLIKQGRDDWAGCLLAICTVKPHIIVVVLAVILGWGAWHRRWGLIRGFAAVLAVLVLASMVFLPGWIGEFVQAVGRYKGYTDLGPPIQVLCETFLPLAVADPLSTLLSILLFGALGYGWWRTRGTTWNDFLPTVELALIVTTMAMIRTATADQTLLLVPWVHWLSTWVRSGRQRLALLTGGVVMVAPWILFLTTLGPDSKEAPIATTATVTLTLLAYLVIHRNHWFPVRRTEVSENVLA